jgi:hypothetical protein
VSSSKELSKSTHEGHEERLFLHVLHDLHVLHVCFVTSA